MKKVVLVDGVRTPFMRAGTIPGLTATELGVVPPKALIERYPDIPKSVDYVIGANIGNQALHPDGSNMGRLLALRAGIPKSVGAWTVNINCATGLHAVADAAKTIALGTARSVLVVAVEVMADYPALYTRKQRNEFVKAFLIARKKQKPWVKFPQLAAQWVKIQALRHSPLWAIDLGLVDPTTKLRMDQSADLIAHRWNISRKEQDLFALESQRRASAAQKSGRLAEEIVPFKDIAFDNGIRHNQTLEQLARLKPQYPRGFTFNDETIPGTVTPGNSSQITDGACSLLLADEEFARSMGWPILARINPEQWAVAGCDPSTFGFAPSLAIKKLLDATGLSLSDLDLIESNEAFAAVVLAQMRGLSSKRYCEQIGIAEPLGDWELEKTNVNGGGVALGHPISASGARLTLTIAKELKRSQKERGLVTLCIGGGQGEALVLERGE